MNATNPPSPAGPVADGARVRWGPGGLVPVVVQDAADGRVLMLAWMDAEAYRLFDARQAGALKMVMTA